MLDLQQKHAWKFMIVENLFSKVGQIKGDIVGGIAGVGTGISGQTAQTKVTSLYVQAITVPGVMTIEYEEAEIRFPKTLKRPESVTIKFLEDEYGTAWTYLQRWRKQVVAVLPGSTSIAKNALSFASSSIGQPSPAFNVKYMFANNQMAAKKTGIVMLQPGTNNEKERAAARVQQKRILAASASGLSAKSVEAIVRSKGQAALLGARNRADLPKPGAFQAPSLGKRNSDTKYPRIMLYGLSWSSMEDLTLSYDDVGNLYYTATFSVDEIAAPEL